MCPLFKKIQNSYAYKLECCSQQSCLLIIISPYVRSDSPNDMAMPFDVASLKELNLLYLVKFVANLKQKLIN